jgi:SAM-dependent methyltransferase
LSCAVELSTILALLDCRPGERVLDIGGPRRFSARILRRFGYESLAFDPRRLASGQESRGGRSAHRNGRRPGKPRPDRLPFADESIDGVLSMHSLHQAADGARLLADLHRVLKPGTRAVFFEPGLQTSSLADSADPGSGRRPSLPDFMHAARASGFEKVTSVQSPLTLIERRGVARRGAHDVPSVPATEAENGVGFHHGYAVLTRGGDRPRTSRRPGSLRGRIAIDHTELEAAAGQAVTIRATAENTGDTVWLREPSRFGGSVSVGCKLFTTTGRLIDHGLGRAALSRDVPPGDYIRATLRIRVPQNLMPGVYTLSVDLVNELVCSFSDLDPRSACRHSIRVVSRNA